MGVAALIGYSATIGVGAVINSPTSKMGMTVAVFGSGGQGFDVIQGAQMAEVSPTSTCNP
ncbi:MAG TPA: hypothetical protein DGB32_02685 [Dehalococcoidia bacterium]|jgi:Zn-dependent alcohol dehydrogenase|nr:hypothetical protein [Chloroflexota bacterium]HCV27210.1 hypothetical protein [Dehalococcoidia bacterium]|tara:strand:- start:2007 stop:2186 length:180 start_codon:yes stop_codon:yes gene_type:complete